MLLALLLVVAAQPDVIDSWSVPLWASFDGTDTGRVVVTPGSRINLWSIACEQGAVNEETGVMPYQCFPARLRLPESAGSNNGEYLTAPQEMARVQQCFDVRLRKAPDSVVAAATTQDMAPATHIVKQQKTPTLLVVAWAHVEGYTRAFDVFAQTVTDKNEWRPLYLPPPFPLEQLTVFIVQAPGAHSVVEAIRAKKYRTALTRAKASLAFALRSKDLDDHVKAALRANVASAAVLAGSKRDVIVDDGFDDAQYDSGNGSAVDLARRWAKGDVWLGPDPCARRQ